MPVCTTKGIKINVQSKYEEKASNPEIGKYIYSYFIIIENNSKQTVQLIDRHWKILDSYNNLREVKGPGVIGVQPVIAPTEQHSYSSWSVLNTPIGKMYGSFNMQVVSSKEYFEVQIPEFPLVASFVSN